MTKTIKQELSESWINLAIEMIRNLDDNGIHHYNQFDNKELNRDIKLAIWEFRENIKLAILKDDFKSQWKSFEYGLIDWLC